MQLRAVRAPVLQQQLAEVSETHAMRSVRSRNHECGNAAGDNGMQNRPALPAGVPRIYPQLLEERLLGRLWRPRPLPFVATRRIGRQRSTCKRESTAARLPRRTAVAGFRRSKFIINIRVLQGACLPVSAKLLSAGCIAICTSCLLPWYLPQSRSRSDWRRVGPSRNR